MSKPSSPARRRCYISAFALVGAFGAWNLWFVSGGWQRQNHRGEVVLWSISVFIGILGAIDAIRLDRGAKSVSVFAALLLVFHALALCLLWMFLSLLASGGPKR